MLLSFIVGPVLAAMGFGPLGPIAGSAAAMIQAVVYGAAVPAGGLFAFLQAWAMT
ncbi:hypothetical protein CGMCC3_g4311 [Colletotrichum fructicola]|uniref:Uncharacterized protein n=1 Tax=Colletotrichum chrysophilum TaxID=1836956 RepID=A0AAD9A6A8_9PEZI|nr:uncharacterized protein CGMCC3_g4311 [Colletotrichum fructicola]KAE9579751.1 hypothetical protein CGMCC3_g4311 [Colletotrichum fructicola]KAK1841902.1 hypothetical protein CCHR01_15484 [Colletotrichum chrysophilum]